MSEPADQEPHSAGTGVRRWLRARAADLDHIGNEERFPWRVVLLVPVLLVIVRATWPALYLRVEDAALHLAAPLIPAGSPEASWTAPKPPRATPGVLLIDDDAFEDRFRERSPLDRAELARLLDDIRSRAPRLLVVDLDLSPGPALTAEEERAQAALDDALRAFGPGSLLLATPLPARSFELALRRLRWMHALCGAGVRFAHTTLFHSGAYVLRYDPTLPSLGPLAARLAGVQAADAAPFDEPEPCALVAEEVRERDLAPAGDDAADAGAAGRRTLGAAYFLQVPPAIAYYVDNAQARRLAPLNFGYERFARRYCVTAPAPDEDCAAVDDRALAGRVVFLGGAWGQDDLHPTPLGHREGVMLHAAAFHSEQVPVSRRYQPVAAAVEFMFGLVVAFVMGHLWSGYFRALYGTPQTLERIARRYGHAALATALVLGTLWVIAQSSGWLMQHGVWLDPLPLLGVLLLKTLFTARKLELEALRGRPPHEPHDAHEAHEAAAPLTVYDKLARVVDALPRLAAHKLESLAKVASALPFVHAHWDRLMRLWKKVLLAASIALLAWAAFILMAD